MEEKMIIVIIAGDQSGEEFARMTLEEAFAKFAASESLSMEDGQVLQDFKSFLKDLEV